MIRLIVQYTLPLLAAMVLILSPAAGVQADGSDELARLRQALADYQAIAAKGGWQRIADGPLLRIGDVGTRVAAVRHRLEVTGDLTDAPPNGSRFGSALDTAVRRFQARHGLEVDGIVGPQTRAAMNVSATDRVAILAEALRREKTAMKDRLRRAVVVNVPAAELELVDDGRTVLHSRVIVGRVDWPTPLIRGTIRALVINPYWTVPPNIARRELVPKQRRDPAYLTKQDIRVFSDWSAQAAELDPRAVDWTDGRARQGLKLRQDPGPRNPLGQVKFLFDNPFDVYLHDTPHTDLFKKAVRTLSHGCIRVEKAVEIARHLLRGEPDWPADVFDRALASGETQRVELRHPITVMLISRIAWVAADGTVHFRKDPYGRDSGTGPPPETRVCTPENA